jgi:hypothetical protein
MIAPELYYPALIALLLMCNVVLFCVSLYAFVKSSLFVFVILCGGAVCGALANAGDFLLTLIRMADAADEWRAPGVFVYNSLIILQPLAALLSLGGLTWLTIIVITRSSSAGNTMVSGEIPRKVDNG